jgi:hypothetical protein
MDLERLEKAARIFSLYCEADLKTDMAKRIFFSVLPAVATQNELYGTGGIVDEKALRAAAGGRHNLIKYGFRAIKSELTHYLGKKYDEVESVLMANESSNLLAIIKLSIMLFADKGGWGAGYGGDAWKRIAETLHKIVQLDQQLKLIKLRQQKQYRPELLDAEMETLRQLIVEMNVFDGLSHNTDSILSNLVYQEAEEKKHTRPNPGDILEEVQMNFEDIQKLMDAKELSSPIDVFKSIEPILQGSGDINRYKEWVSRIRRTPEMRTQNPNLEDERKTIRLRKELIPYRSSLDYDIKGLTEILHQLNSPVVRDPDFEGNALVLQGMNYGYNGPANLTHTDIIVAIEKLRRAKDEEMLPSTVNYPAAEKHADVLNGIFKEIGHLCSRVQQQISTLTPDGKKKFIQHIVGLLEKATQGVKSFKFFLDAI